VTRSGGNLRYGILYARDGAPADSVADAGFSVSEREHAEDYRATTAAARVQWDVSGDTTVGFLALDRWLLRPNKGLYVEGAPREASNQVVGLDAKSFLTPQLEAEVGAYASHASDLDDVSLNGHAAVGRFTYREDSFRVKANYERQSEEFRSEAGYLPRAGGYNNLFVKIDGYYRSEDPWAREVSPGIWAGAYVGDDGTVSERNLGANTYWRFGPRVWVVPVYMRDAERVDGAWLDTNSVQLYMGVETFRSFDVQFGFLAGEMIIRSEELLEEGQAPYVGAGFEPNLSINVRPMNRLATTLALRERLLWDAYGGAQLSTQPIVRLSSAWFFSRELDLRGILEWNDLDGVLTGDVLLSYEPRPGTVAYLGYRHGGRLEGEGPLLEERAFFMKLSILNLL